jgi:hypothetical protein
LMKSAAGDSVVLQLPGGTECLTVLEVRYERIVSSNPAARFSGVSLWTAHAESGFSDSTRRMQCDHKPMMRRKSLDLATFLRCSLGARPTELRRFSAILAVIQFDFSATQTVWRRE